MYKVTFDYGYMGSILTATIECEDMNRVLHVINTTLKRFPSWTVTGIFKKI